MYTTRLTPVIVRGAAGTIESMGCVDQKPREELA